MLEFLKGLFGKADPESPGADPARVAALGLPFEVMVVPGKEAVQTRESLLPRHDITPVILGDIEDVEQATELLREASDSTEEILADAGQVDLEAWILEQAHGDPDYYRVDEDEWPADAAPVTELTVHREVLTQRPKKAVLVGLIPTADSWNVPAIMRYGGWNECPPPEVHVAFHRKWSAQYGSAIACMSGDVIECTVSNPPRTKEGALQLAREQFAYCPDIVQQGVESVEALAATLLGARIWYFWWD